MLLRDRYIQEEITWDRIQRFKHDVPRHWHFRLAGIITYLTREANISAVVQELSISCPELPHLSQESSNFLVEIISVLQEVFGVARQLEAGRNGTISWAPCAIHGFYDNLKIIYGTAASCSTNFQHNAVTIQVNLFTELESTARPTVASICAYDIARDKLRYFVSSSLLRTTYVTNCVVSWRGGSEIDGNLCRLFP
ncbi:hypothetical protein FGB62_233g027 [Gracilaria domingensis]|nr:hypothetical protein FGB62_233g027 [Gracilaria domingensis]